MRILTLLWLLLPSFAFSEPLQITSSEIVFKAMGYPGFLKIDSTGGKIDAYELDLKEGMISGYLESKVDGFDTGLSLRNDHMKNKYMEMSKFPVVRMDIANIPLDCKAFKGLLTVKGVKKAVSGKCEIKNQRVKAVFTFTPTEYGMEKPSYLGVGLENDIAIEVDFAYKKAP